MAKKMRFASDQPLMQQPLKVDRENLIIYGVTAMKAGIDAAGHNLSTDMRTLEIMRDFGNVGYDHIGYNWSGRGHITGTFGHMGISENETGRKVQRVANFRIEGDRLVHDSYLIEEARISPQYAQDPIEYILRMAENNPSDIGESVVIDTDEVWTLPDGSEIPALIENENGFWEEVARPENALTAFPVMRPVRFYYCDIVGDGALTPEGLFNLRRFSGAGSASGVIEEMFRYIDQARERYHISLEEMPQKVEQLLTAYMSARKRENPMSRKTRVRNKLAFDQEPILPPDDEQEEEEDLDDDGYDDETADESEDELDAALASAEQIVTEEAEEAEAAEASLLQNMAATVLELSEKLGKVTRLAVAQQKQLESLEARFAALEGEPVVKTAIPQSRYDRTVSPITNALRLSNVPNPPSQLPQRGNRAAQSVVHKDPKIQRALEKAQARQGDVSKAGGL